MLVKDILTEARVVNFTGRYLYHIAVKNPYLSGIMDKGIRPRLARFESQPRVFLLPSRKHARSLAAKLRNWRLVGKGTKYSNEWKHEEPTFWLVKIDVGSLLPGTKIYFDSASHSYDGLYVTKPIPTQAIVDATAHNY